MLQYTVLENLLTPAPDDYVAQPVDVRTHDLPAIFKRIVARYPGYPDTDFFGCKRIFRRSLYNHRI
jgi:hypothetical protein